MAGRDEIQTPKEMNMLRNAYINYLTQQPARRIDGFLWVSDLGFHPYKAMNRVINRSLETFPPATISAMEDGNMMEAHSVGIWAKSLPSTIHTQVPLFDQIWSGYADMIIGMGTDRPIIVEHKTSKEFAWNFNKQTGPIKGYHACQLWMYGLLYRDKYGVQPDLILYYRSMGDRWAELTVTTADDGSIRMGGYLNGNAVEVTTTIFPDSLRIDLERYYYKRELPDPPEGIEWDYAGQIVLGAKHQC